MVKAEALLGWFTLPCELVSTKVVKQKLTPTEILTCCDVPVGMIQPMANLLVDDSASLSRDFVAQPPAKVLQFAFDAIFVERLELTPFLGGPTTTGLPNPGLKLSTFDPNVVLGCVEASHVSAVKNDDAVTNTSL